MWLHCMETLSPFWAEHQLNDEPDTREDLLYYNGLLLIHLLLYINILHMVYVPY